MNKKLLKLMLPVVVVATGIIFLLTYTYTVEGKIIDISTQQPVQDVKAKIAKHETSTDDTGSYIIKGIKLYERKELIIEPPITYVAPNPIKLGYSSRKIKNDLELEPTIEKVFELAAIASKNGQYDYLWDFMHPDDRAYWESKNRYLKLLRKRDDLLTQLGESTKSEAIGKNIRTLKTWKHEVTGKMYEGVLEVPSEIITVTDGKEQPETIRTYYQKVDGYYHYFTGVDKAELQKAIDDLEAYL